MFSRSNHHDRKVPNKAGPPPTALSGPTLVSKGLATLTDLSAHHYHLESLLDSALATLMIILDATATPILTAHTTEVLRALHRRTMTPAPAHATYADVTSTATHPIRPPTVVTEIKSPKPMRPQRNPDPNSVPDVVFRLDLHDAQPTSQPHPSVLFRALSKDPDVRADGSRWTRSGNLTVKYHDYRVDKVDDRDPGLPDGFTEIKHILTTWRAIGPLLGLLGGIKGFPRVDHGVAWHSVVVHDVPVPPGDDDPHDWLRKGGFEGKIKGFSRMSSDKTQTNVPFRISLTFKADADFLVKHGTLMFGSWCRGSHLSPTPRLRSQTP
ncbi:hypothetical protein B0H16DRAFT_1747759 [Mycena metata]|uniref:Uncharacterized protein n=1 Tax=Mycena metata TaxID=1033252 RepID=A0AAD7GS88_9AGAR|nr:hypothetical protein B0H16DRAFT_1747759 [Mycena metata]